MKFQPIEELTPQQVKNQIHELEKEKGISGNKRTRLRNRGKKK